MALLPGTIDCGEIIRERMTIRVTGVKTTIVRFSVASWIFRFGAWVAGTGLEIDVASSAHGD